MGLFSERLVIVMGDRTFSAVARMSGIAEGTIRKYVRGDAEPTMRNLIALSRALKTSIEFLAGLSPHPEGMFTVPYLEESYFSASQLEIHRHRMIMASQIAFQKSWLEITTGVSVDALRSLYMEGDSMGQTIRNGNLMLIERLFDSDIPLNGIYAIQLSGGGLSVQRLQMQGGSRIQVLCDNPNYKPFDVDMADVAINALGGRLSIVGRIVWVAHRV